MTDLTPEAIAELRGLMDTATREMVVSASLEATYSLMRKSTRALFVGLIEAAPALLDAAERLAEVTAERDERDALIADLTTALDYRENQVRTQRIALRAERDALAASVARVREGHTPYPDYLPGPNGVPIRWERCQRCNGAYPCQPIRALDGSGS